MNPTITAIDIPSHSAISRHVPGAHFHDCYEVPVQATEATALEIYLGAVSHTPAWVNRLMAVRNQAVSWVGLKDLGPLGAVDVSKPARAYRVGDRVGIFSVLQIGDDEVILEDADKHLCVKVSVCKLVNGSQRSVAVSTVVHTHNTLGRLYMLVVAPVHKRIVPAMLARATAALSAASGG